jgi:hypothetical protein
VVVEPVERVLLAVGQALGLLLRREDPVDVAQRVELEGLLLVRRELGGPVARLVEAADLVVGRDQRGIADDGRIDRRLDLAVRQHLALERGVVVDQRDSISQQVLGSHRRVHATHARPPGLADAVDLHEASVDVFSLFVPKHARS